ncbi:MAG TPA: hypothetical protein VLY24_00355 [Bryobacteraceae bacterium]|nr:hypothetical protein [Bryobacteraceae bacterium]
MAHRKFCRSRLTAFALLALGATQGWGAGPDEDIEHSSPDKALRARVHTDANGESSVQIEDRRSGAILLVRDDRSKDGAHGHGVVHSAWTPDSQFFVASLESMADHPSWAHPIWVYSREYNHVVELWKIGISVVANFQLRAPDVLETRVLAQRPNGRRAGQAFSTSLHTLLAKGKQQQE